MRALLYTGTLLLLAAACQYIPVLSGSDEDKDDRPRRGVYTEDLSTLRPEYKEEDLVIPNGFPNPDIDSLETGDHYIPVNDTVNMVLDSIARIRLSENKVSGYTILVYSSINREDARKALGRLLQHIPDAKADLVYQQPYFRVKTGKFMHEIHAYGLLEEVKEEFNTAIIIPETFKIVSEDGK